jgi:hypothetical protein
LLPPPPHDRQRLPQPRLPVTGRTEAPGWPATALIGPGTAVRSSCSATAHTARTRWPAGSRSSCEARETCERSMGRKRGTGGQGHGEPTSFSAGDQRGTENSLLSQRRRIEASSDPDTWVVQVSEAWDGTRNRTHRNRPSQGRSGKRTNSSASVSLAIACLNCPSTLSLDSRLESNDIHRRW